MVGRKTQEHQDKFDEHDKHQLRLVEDRNNARLHTVFKKKTYSRTQSNLCRGKKMKSATFASSIPVDQSQIPDLLGQPD